MLFGVFGGCSYFGIENKEYNPHIFSKTDEGYEWLEEDDSKCIVLDNPYYDETLFEAP
jgi:hypothetical protein